MTIRRTSSIRSMECFLPSDMSGQRTSD